MTGNQEKDVVTSKNGVFNDLSNYIKLVARLMGDKRVNPFLKLLPVGTVAYFIIPDIVPGPIDDAMVMWLGTYLFIELCPTEVVQEHRDELDSVIPGEWQDPEEESEEQVIDAEFWEEQ